jgi:hypothetical protein
MLAGAPCLVKEASSYDRLAAVVPESFPGIVLYLFDI